VIIFIFTDYIGFYGLIYQLFLTLRFFMTATSLLTWSYMTLTFQDLLR
jgi:hypothetical protein